MITHRPAQSLLTWQARHNVNKGNQNEAIQPTNLRETQSNGQIVRPVRVLLLCGCRLNSALYRSHW